MANEEYDVRVFSYAAYDPRDPEELEEVLRQLDLCKDYYRRALTVANQAQEAFHNRVQSLYAGGEIERLEGDIAALYERRKSTKDKDLKKKIDVDIKILKADLRNLKSAKKTHPLYKEAQEEAKLVRARGIAQARKEIGPTGLGLNHGGYSRVDDAVKAQEAKRKGNSSISFGCVGKWRTLGIPWSSQKKGDADRFMNGLTILKIVDGLDGSPITPEFFRRPKRQRRAIIKVNIGNRKMGPKWVSFPCMFHRPIPENAEVILPKLVLKNYRRGIWSFEVTVRTPKPPKPTSGSVTHVAVGWRALESGGLRVITLSSNGSTARQLTLPGEIIQQYNHANTVRSSIDKLFNQTIADLQEAWKATPPPSDWFPSEREHVSKRRSPHYLCIWLESWENEHRYIGDESAFAIAENFLNKYLPYKDYEDGTRRRALAKRKKIFEQWALDICRGSKEIHLGEINLKSIAEKKDSGPQRNRFMAGVSQFILILTSTANRLNVPLSKTKSEYISQLCPSCGGALEIINARDLYRSCHTCQITWDQDASALQILQMVSGANIGDKDLILGEVFTATKTYERLAA